jgi:hypothetical protein
MASQQVFSLRALGTAQLAAVIGRGLVPNFNNDQNLGNTTPEYTCQRAGNLIHTAPLLQHQRGLKGVH